MSTYQVHERKGKVTLIAGVTAVLLGFVLQAINVHSFATQAPPQVVANAGSTAELAQIAGFVIFGGVVLTVVGIIRYAQSGRDGSSVIASAPVERADAPPLGGQASLAQNSGRVSTSVFCSACGDRIVGEGRYCASCGTPTTS